MSSSPSEQSHQGSLFGAVLARGPVADTTSDGSWLRAMLDAEAALSSACAEVDLVPSAAAEAVVKACADAAAFDVAALGAAAAGAGNPVVPLVRAIEGLAGPSGAAALHLGATSQDILDTAMVLVARRSVAALLPDLLAAADAAAGLARRHRDTAMVGRTLLQQAAPTTFGLKAAGWALALDHAAERLTFADSALPVQLGGAVGTLQAYGSAAPEVVAAMAGRLGLQVPLLPWHTARGPLADLAGALGATAGALGKIALDVCLLAQSEVGEVSEGTPGRGGSSAMPHKHNPVAAISARAATIRTPGLVATMLAAMAHEHERAAGPWHAEWLTLADLLQATGSAAAWICDCLTHLRVDTEAMQRNLAAVGGELAAANAAAQLTPALGRSSAHDLVSAAVERARTNDSSLAKELADDPGCELNDAQLRELSSIGTGQAGPMVDRVLAGRVAMTAVEVHAESFGDEAAPVVLMMGSLGSTYAMWAPQIEALSARFRVVAYDARGHGESPVPDGPYSLDDLVDDAVALLDRLGVQQAHVVGLSLGGMTAMRMAIREPARVDRLALLCTSAELGPASAWHERAAMVRASGTEAVADAVIARWFTPDLEGDPLWTRSREMVAATPAEGYASCCEAIAAMDQRADLGLIGAPTLVLAGADDPSTPPPHLELIAAGVPGSRLQVIAHAAHLANLQQPQVVSAALLAHLDPAGQSRHEQGMTVRRAVLGAAHVDRSIANTTPFTAPFQDFITRYAWGDVWTRPGLDRRARSMLTLALLTALGQTHELAMHVRAAITNGLTPEEIGEVLLHSAVYAGVPAANSAFGVAQQVLAELAKQETETEQA